MKEPSQDFQDEPRLQTRKTPIREGRSQHSGTPSKEEEGKQNSFLSTKRMSDSQKDDMFENYVPIIKRISETEGLRECTLHPTKLSKYFDISSPQARLCSKCVLELVVDRNFNAAMTKEGILN